MTSSLSGSVKAHGAGIVCDASAASGVEGAGGFWGDIGCNGLAAFRHSWDAAPVAYDGIGPISSGHVARTVPGAYVHRQ